jgi:sugar phosphate isomerase/epimerase
MPDNPSAPVIGAAMNSSSLAVYRGWIIEQQRDLELQDFIDVPVLDGGWRDVATSLERLLDGYQGRLGVHGPFWGFEIDSRDPLIAAVITKRFLQALEACEVIGATQMVIHSPFTAWAYNNSPGSQEATFERIRATLKDVVTRAENIGCEIVIENIEDKDPITRIRLAESFNSKAVRVSLDTGHAHYAHVSTGAPPVDYYIDAAGDTLAHLHIQDNDGYADRHWSPGEGTVRWQAVFRALGRLKVKPRLLLEVRDKTQIRRAADYLAALGLVV